jgi:hypothetical protein
MTMLETGRDADPEGLHRPTTVTIAVKTGHDEERMIEIDVGQSAKSILIMFAAERGCAVEDLTLLRDGEADPISVDVIIGLDYPHHHRHHIHHPHDLEVIVHYQADTHRHQFKRFQTVEAVLDWAIPAFGIDPTMAPEFELARSGTKEELPLGEHLGHLAGRQDRLELDLLRSEMPNG